MEGTQKSKRDKKKKPKKKLSLSAKRQLKAAVAALVKKHLKPYLVPTCIPSPCYCFSTYFGDSSCDLITSLSLHVVTLLFPNAFDRAQI